MTTSITEELVNQGFGVLETPDDNAAVPNEQAPYLCIEVPANYRETFDEVDGADPTHDADDDPIPNVPGARMRRLFSRLKRAGQLDNWHAFAGNDGKTYCHLRFADQTQALSFWRLIDWDATTIPFGGRRPEHAFGGDEIAPPEQ